MEPSVEGAVELSVVIATHDRRRQLERCLGSLALQTASPSRFEVIVAADGCDDGSAELAEALTAPFALTVLRLEKAGQPGAQNAAIEAARGRSCLFLDDDVIASPGLVAEHLEAHRRDPAAIGIGALTQEPVSAGDWFADAFAHGFGEHYEDLAGRQPCWHDCYGANFSAPRQLLLEAGGMATDLDVAYDFDIALRLCQLGCRLYFLPEAGAIHSDTKGGADLLRDARRQGATHVELARRHPGIDREILVWDAGAGPNELRLRRLALSTGLSPHALAGLGRLLPGRGRRMIWLHFVRRLSFWSGVHHAADRDEWRLLTKRPEPAGPLVSALPFALSLLDVAEAVPL
ncbi:MAG TPA: glycosyltransferase [Solirubrobacterales bacterium]|nr:glycosyltransferase [Solirubrobacterales bacterium]